MTGLPELSSASDPHSRAPVAVECGVVNDGLAVHPGLWQCATVNGATALNLNTGTIAPGHLADFTTIDLAAPGLAGYTRENLLCMMLFGGRVYAGDVFAALGNRM